MSSLGGMIDKLGSYRYRYLFTTGKCSECGHALFVMQDCVKENPNLALALTTPIFICPNPNCKVKVVST